MRERKYYSLEKLHNEENSVGEERVQNVSRDTRREYIVWKV
jgi:hypothetical protein